MREFAKCCQRHDSPAVLTLAPYMLIGVSNRVGLENVGAAAGPSRAMSLPAKPACLGQVPNLVHSAGACQIASKVSIVCAACRCGCTSKAIMYPAALAGALLLTDAA